MSEILQYVITSLISVIATGGLGSIFYFKQQRKLKDSEVKAAEVEVKSAEIENLKSVNDEWKKIYDNLSEEKKQLEEDKKKLEDKVDEIFKSKDAAWEKYADCRNECSKKDLVISELNWYRCEMNGCPYRRPPRKYGEMDFPKDGINPAEHPDPNSL